MKFFQGFFHGWCIDDGLLGHLVSQGGIREQFIYQRAFSLYTIESLCGSKDAELEAIRVFKLLANCYPLEKGQKECHCNFTCKLYSPQLLTEFFLTLERQKQRSSEKHSNKTLVKMAFPRKNHMKTINPNGYTFIKLERAN